MSLSFYNLSKNDLIEKIKSLNEKPYRAEQIWNFAYVQGIKELSDIQNIPNDLKEKLQNELCFRRPIIDTRQDSNDGTIKWLLKMDDGSLIETVFIPEKTRGTLCISSQVGCILTCSFCHTGTQKFVRNLSAGEILQQLIVAKDEINDWNKNPKITNIVLMGMGEPLYNYDEVCNALKIAMDQKGINFPRSKITLSTSGVVPMIEKCGTDLSVHLAISLHAVTDGLRNILVPLNKKYNLSQLLEACKKYPANRHHKITFEYVMLNNVNDSKEHAKELARLIEGIPAKINLIPFNPWPGSNYTCSSSDKILTFAKVLREAGFMALVRTPRGQDILAACGQLKTSSERNKPKHNLTPK